MKYTITIIVLILIIICNIVMCVRFNIINTENMDTIDILNENTENDYKQNIDKFELAPDMYSKVSNKDELNDLTTYDSNNYDIEYHDNEKDLEKEQGFGLDIQEIVVYDSDTKQLNKLSVPSTQTLPIYNEPGHFKYGSTSYVPSYSDSILLSTRNLYYFNKLSK